MRVILYNRILLFLGFAGLFISGLLSLAHLNNEVPPCGMSGGCEVVTTGPSSLIFGVLPWAYVGFLGYVVMTGLALARATAPPNIFKGLSLVGYLAAVGGTALSFGLQCYSFFVIKEVCTWCLSSAIDMTLTLIVYALLYQALSDSDQPVPARPAAAHMDFFLASAFGAIWVIGLFVAKSALHDPGPLQLKFDAVTQTYPLIPANPNLYGDPNSPVTILEFADLNCPACQKKSPEVKEFVRQHEGKVRLIYRHFPIPSHKTSMLAAAIDEYAAEKGRFWDYTIAVMSGHKEVDDPQELYGIAQSINLDPKEIKKRLANDSDPIYQRLAADENEASVLGITSTPTFILLAPGEHPQAFLGNADIVDRLKKPPYDKYTGGG